jgi:hypothetical protein
VNPRPFPDKSLRGTGINFAFEQLTVEIENSILSLILRMKVWRTMIPIKHANNYTKEHTDRRHNKTSTREQITEWSKASKKTPGSTLETAFTIILL